MGAINEIPPPFMMDSEILEIAKPLKQAKAICRWFKKRGYTFEPKPNGLPLIVREHFVQVASGKVTAESALAEEPSKTPDIASLINLTKSRHKAT